ncbi:serine protease [Kitasatospora purpeofusca]|uniref:Serine protease n=1 Tax=Kitasatospora purpeofusca TaxID=67352 RepID=A0ABZ1TYU2_9ACTN|nr:serine protease [Kitasatospora purpeofusca]
MTITSPLPRRSVLRALTVAAALGGAAPASGYVSGSAAFAAEPETYTLTIRHLDRDGRVPTHYRTSVTGISGPGAGRSEQPHDASGTASVRLPGGRYLLESSLWTDRVADGTDWIVQPRLDLDRDTTVTVDARTTAPVDVTPPDGPAAFLNSGMFIEVTHGGATRMASIVKATPTLRTAHLGPEAEAGSVKQWYDSYWTTRAGGYALGRTFSGTRALTGLTHHYTAGELATLELRAVARPDAGGAGAGSGAGTGAVAGTAGIDLAPTVGPAAGPSVGASWSLPVPGTATLFVTPLRGTWDVVYTAPAAPGTRPNRYFADGIAVRAGATTTHTFDGPVVGPALTGRAGVERDGDTLTADLPLLADGDGHVPTAPSFDTAWAGLYRDGALLHARSGGLDRATFTVPPGPASYRLAATVARRAATGATTRVNASWTFRSATTAGPVPVPVSVVRFSPGLGPAGTAPAGIPLRVPVTVQGAAADGRVRALTVSMSADGGRSWTVLPVHEGAVTVPNPAAGTAVSLRAELTDTDGNTLDQTLVDAYRTG